MPGKLEAVVGDIADVGEHQAEAYVVAANNELWMGAGAAGALKRAAGEEVEREAVAQGPIAVGDAVVTGAGTMPAPAKGLIHAAAMGFTDRTQIYASAESVAAATRRAFELCDEQGWRSVVLPALGTGVGGLEFDEAAAAMVTTAREYLQSGSGIQRVRFVVTTDDRRETFQRLIDTAGDSPT